MALFLSFAISHADCVPFMWEKECGIALDFESRLRSDAVTCQFGTHCVSFQGGTEISMFCHCDWDSGCSDIYPLSVKTCMISLAHQCSCHQERWHYLFSINAWTRLPFSFFFSFSFFNVRPLVWMAECWQAKAEQQIVMLWAALKPVALCSTLESSEVEEEIGCKPQSFTKRQPAVLPRWHPAQLEGGWTSVILPTVH